MKRAKIWLLILLLGILFPMAWPGKFSEKYRQIFNAVFSPEWMHWLMHAVLYAGLAILLLRVFDLRSNHQTAFAVLGMVLLVGIIQEGMQLWSGVQSLRWNSLFDLGVDLTGAGLGLLTLGIAQNLSIKSEQKASPKEQT
jgi:hypothetical protein